MYTRRRLCYAMTWAVSIVYYCQGTDPLASLSDEFDSDSLGDWSRAYVEDGWTADLIQSAHVSDGVFTAIPFTSGWFGDYRGNFFYKELSGDFIVTAKANATGRSGIVPVSSFSLGGIMARVPNGATGTWTAGNEVWSFIAMGKGLGSSTQFEVKTTVQSSSVLELRNIGPDPELHTATMQLASFGNNFMVLVQPEGLDWQVFRCYGTSASGAIAPNSEIPAHQGPLQVGMHMYTDWDAWNGQGAPPVANANPALLLNQSNPDLVMSYEYIRFCTPDTSHPLLAQDWFDPGCTGPGTCCLPNVNDVLQVLGVNGDSCVTSNVVNMTGIPTNAPSTPRPTDAPSGSPTRSPAVTDAPTLNPTSAPSAATRLQQSPSLSIMLAFVVYAILRVSMI